MTVAVIVPWRGGCPYREQAWAWLLQRWKTAHPDWQVVLGRHVTGPWVKALAVAGGLDRTDADTLVVADADVWVDGLDLAVAALEEHQWAVPHRDVHRLSFEGTTAVLAGTPFTEAPLEHRGRYTGHAGGGIVVLRRATYEAVPLDARFAGWGQEDDSWALALHLLAGRPWRGTEPLWHLWHPSQPRLERKVGSMESQRLWLRYRHLGETSDVAAMQALVSEGVSGTPPT